MPRRIPWCSHCTRSTWSSKSIWFLFFDVVPEQNVRYSRHETARLIVFISLHKWSPKSCAVFGCKSQCSLWWYFKKQHGHNGGTSHLANLGDLNNELHLSSVLQANPDVLVYKESLKINVREHFEFSRILYLYTHTAHEPYHFEKMLNTVKDWSLVRKCNIHSNFHSYQYPSTLF